MNFLKRIVLCVTLILHLPALACGDIEDGYFRPAGDSSLQILSLLDALPSLPLRDDIGKSAMRISTQSESAQRYFNQGLSLLHSYWEFEALRAFRQAIRDDPMAAMPYWGVYLAATQMMRRAARFASAAPLQLRSEVLPAAMALASNTSAREQLHIQAITDWHHNGRDAYLQALENLLARFPDDIQAQLFLADSLRYGDAADGRTPLARLRGESILRDLMVQEPASHAAHHYWIHAIEKKKQVAPALSSAEQIAALASRAGHIVHMPGHVFFRLGHYEKSRRAFLASARVDESYLLKSTVPVIYHWNRVHNLHYLALNSAEQGRYEDGLRWARQARTLALDAAQRKDYATGTFFDQGLLAPAKLEIRFGHWTRAIDELHEIDVSEDHYGRIAVLYYQVMLGFVRGKAAFEKRDLIVTEQQLEKLSALETKAGTFLEARGIPNWLAPVIGVMALDLQASLAMAGGNTDRADALLQQAMTEEATFARGSDPPRNIRPVGETAAAAWLEREQWHKSRSIYQAMLAARPRSGFALFGLAQVYDKAGESDQALLAYQRFLSAWRYADEDLTPVQIARRRMRELAH